MLIIQHTLTVTSTLSRLSHWHRHCHDWATDTDIDTATAEPLTQTPPLTSPPTQTSPSRIPCSQWVCRQSPPNTAPIFPPGRAQGSLRLPARPSRPGDCSTFIATAVMVIYCCELYILSKALLYVCIWCMYACKMMAHCKSRYTTWHVYHQEIKLLLTYLLTYLPTSLALVMLLSPILHFKINCNP